MKFYVRRSKKADIEGPFTVAQINTMLREKKLSVKSVALYEEGKNSETVQNAPADEWIRLPEIPGYEPDPAEERNCLFIALLILAIVAVIVIIGAAKLADLFRGVE